MLILNYEKENNRIYKNEFLSTYNRYNNDYSGLDKL